MLEPPVSLQLEADREQEFTLRAPGMSQVLHRNLPLCDSASLWIVASVSMSIPYWRCIGRR